MFSITNYPNANQSHNEFSSRTCPEWLLTKKQEIRSVGKSMEKTGTPLTHYWWECKLVEVIGENNMEVPQNIKKKNRTTPPIPVLAIYVKKVKTQFRRCMHSMITAALFHSQDMKITQAVH